MLNREYQPERATSAVMLAPPPGLTPAEREELLAAHERRIHAELARIEGPDWVEQSAVKNRRRSERMQAAHRWRNMKEAT